MRRTARRLVAGYALLAAFSFTVSAVVSTAASGGEGFDARAAVRDGEQATSGEGRFVGGSSGGKADANEPTALTLGWVGDTMFGTTSAAPPGNGDVLFDRVRRSLQAPDLMFGNLEGVLATSGSSKCGGGTPGPNCYAFRASPAYAGALRRAGFDAMNLANNHALDYGAGAQQETVAALRRSGVAVTGRPGEITVIKRNGVRVALLGFAPYRWASSLTDLAAATRLVAARSRADVVVVAIHAGAEGSDKTHTPRGHEMAYGEDRGDARAFAHAVIDAGADLVVGSGPHVVRGLEAYRDRMIAYSLGDFAGWHNFGLGGTLSASGILTVRLGRDGRMLGGRWQSVSLVGPGIPAPQPDNATARLVRTLSTQDFGGAAVRVGGDGTLRPPG